jgi:hypothetical protein
VKSHNTSLRQQGIESPFPFPQREAGAGAFPPRRKNSGSPRKRARPPCAIPRIRLSLCVAIATGRSHRAQENISMAATSALTFMTFS